MQGIYQARTRFGALLGLGLLTAISLLLLPVSAASAATLVVNGVGDGSDQAPGSPCETESGSCTLRAAIEVANAEVGLDEINFDATLFDGSSAGTIVLQSQLPPLTDPVKVRDLCPPNQYHDIPSHPCIGIDAAGQETGLRVESDEVLIEGISVIDATVGIAVLKSSDEFIARRDRLGVNLEGEAGPNSTGIFLGPGANDATLGGYSILEGNWIAYNSVVGLDLEGASRNSILGNSFGLSDVAPAPNGKDIEITDVKVGDSVVKAVENEVGQEIPGLFGSPTDYCDKGCNLISGAATTAIDLQGDGGAERPASGPTEIRSNFIGVDWWGKTAIPNEGTGILVGGADGVTIGGPQEEEGNVIDGGVRGIVAGPESVHLLIEGNTVGWGSNGPKLDPPSSGGIAVTSYGVPGFDSGPSILDNTVTATSGVDIEAGGRRATILGNVTVGGDIGIRAYKAEFSPGFYIGENGVFGPNDNGILLQADQSSVMGNLVSAAGAAGIKIDDTPEWGVREDQIGGWAEDGEDENQINSSGGAAIEVIGTDASEVYIRRNAGTENAGPFIDLGGDGLGNLPSGPNGGVQAPVIEVAGTEAAAGSARHGAQIYVFAKKGKSPGEISRFLGASQANESGQWYVDYVTPIPAGTRIAVDQVAEPGTSELTTDVATETGSSGAPAASGCGSGPAPPCPVEGILPPTTRIAVGPHRRGRTATFEFVSRSPSAEFECSLDDAPFASCRSPRIYRHMQPGRHLFRVRAVEAGRVDPTPAKRKFTIRR